MNVEGWFAPNNLEIEKSQLSPLRGEVQEEFSRHFGPAHCNLSTGGGKNSSSPTLDQTEHKNLARSLARATADAPVPTKVEILDFEGLSQGDSGADVTRVQRVLRKWNSQLGVSESGRFDTSTRQALTLYKAIYGGQGNGASIDSTTAEHLQAMEDGSFWNDPPPKSPTQQLLYHASRQLGKPYVLGGDGVRSTDCGKLTSQALSQSGLGEVSRLADMQYRVARNGEGGLGLHKSNPEPGDLVFFRVPTSQSSIAYDGVTHVTLYVGDGMTLAASSAAGKVVLQPLSQLQRYVAGFGRVNNPQLASR